MIGPREALEGLGDEQRRKAGPLVADVQLDVGAGDDEQRLGELREPVGLLAGRTQRRDELGLRASLAQGEQDELLDGAECARPAGSVFVRIAAARPCGSPAAAAPRRSSATRSRALT